MMMTIRVLLLLCGPISTYMTLAQTSSTIASSTLVASTSVCSQFNLPDDDEAYSDFVLDKNEFISFAELDTEKKHTIIVNSLSKNFGMSGWRLGYMISNEELINQTLKINQHLITCPSTILEYYIVKYFEDILKITKPQIKV